MPTAFPSRPWADAVAVCRCIAPIQQPSQRPLSRPDQDTGLRASSGAQLAFSHPEAVVRSSDLPVGPGLGKDRETQGHATDGFLHRPFSPVLPNLDTLIRVDPAPATCALIDFIPIHTHLSHLPVSVSRAAQDRQYVMANVPKPGPANLMPGAGLDEWLEEAKQCHYLPESVMKQLCEMVKEVLMEGSSALPTARRFVLTPRTRVQHTTNRDARHDLRRHTRPIL